MSPGAPDTAWSKLEGWKDESTLQPHNVFELGTTGLEIQHLNHETIASRGTDSKKKHINLHLKREWLVNLNANYPTAFSMLATEPLREERLLLTTEILGVLFFFKNWAVSLLFIYCPKLLYQILEIANECFHERLARYLNSKLKFYWKSCTSLNKNLRGSVHGQPILASGQCKGQDY